MVRHAIAILVLLVASAGARAQDYAREKRIEAEIVPGLMVGDAVKMRTAGGREFLGILAKAEKPKAAIVLVHGRNVHPEHELVGALRMKLHELGYTTLAIQMPILAAETPHEDPGYRALFPEAGERIAAAQAFLRASGEKRLVLVSHSLGAAMADMYFANHVDSQFSAWVSMGITSGYGAGAKNASRPLLDIQGDADFPEVLKAAPVRRGVATRQVVIPNANHMYTGREGDVANTIAAWLAEVAR